MNEVNRQLANDRYRSLLKEANAERQSRASKNSDDPERGRRSILARLGGLVASLADRLGSRRQADAAPSRSGDARQHGSRHSETPAS